MTTQFLQEEEKHNKENPVYDNFETSPTDNQIVLDKTEVDSTLDDFNGVIAQGQSISKIIDALNTNQSVDKSTRMSLEGLSDSSDELPPIASYTADLSMINYDTTLAWVQDFKIGEHSENVKKKSDAFLLAFLSWVVSTLKRHEEVADDLKGNVHKAKELSQSIYRSWGTKIDNAKDNAHAIKKFFDALDIKEGEIDLSFLDESDSSDISISPILELLFKAASIYLVKGLPKILWEITFNRKKRDEYKDFTKQTVEVTDELLETYDVSVVEANEEGELTLDPKLNDRITELAKKRITWQELNQAMMDHLPEDNIGFPQMTHKRVVESVTDLDVQKLIKKTQELKDKVQGQGTNSSLAPNQISELHAAANRVLETWRIIFAIENSYVQFNAMQLHVLQSFDTLLKELKG